MSSVFYAQSLVMLLVYLAIVSVSIFAFVNSLLYSAEAYRAADKLTKPTWCTILGLGALLQLPALGAGVLVSLILLIAALVYLADVRPALSSLYRR